MSGILFFTVVLLLLLSTSCGTFRMSDRKLESRLTRSQVPFTLGMEEAGGQTVRVLRSAGAAPGAPQILFIHGAPGSLDDSLPYFTESGLWEEYRLVAYDRPGYGFSAYGEPVVDLEAQARVARDLVEPDALVVGHSFGGSVAMRMLLDYGGDVAGGLIIAGALSPEDQKLFFFNRPASWPLFNWMLSGAWKSANAEKLAYQEELRKFQSLWDSMNGQAVLVHGTRDRLVPYENSLYAMSMIPRGRATLHTLIGENHFILWSEKSRMIELIEEIQRKQIGSIMKY